MKTRIFIVALLIGISTVAWSQPEGKRNMKTLRNEDVRLERQQLRRNMIEALNLTGQQKESLKQSMLQLHKEMKPLRNELGELMAHQQTLITADNPDLKAIDKNIEKMGDVRTDIAKLVAKSRLDLRARLTEEQRMKFDMMKGQLFGEFGQGMMNRKQHQGLN